MAFYYKIYGTSRTIIGKVTSSNLVEYQRQNYTGKLQITCEPIEKTYSDYLIDKFGHEQISEDEFLDVTSFINFMINEGA